jgi:hypothetical protein
MNRITFGCYQNSICIIDFLYDNICERILSFAKEIEKDRYDRIFNAEPLLTFAINREIYNYSIEYIYRHFVYDKLRQHGEYSDELELYDMMQGFVIV